jgi:hypothetical protein
MAEFAIGKPLKMGALEGGDGGFVLVETKDEPCQLKFTYETAEDLIVALRAAQGQIHLERQKAGKPLIQFARIQKIAAWETGVDHLKEVAVIRTRFECQGQPKFPQLCKLNFSHPVHESFVSSARTRPDLSFSLSRYELPRMFSVTA